MLFYGRFGEKEPLGYLGVAKALAHQTQYLLLARREGVEVHRQLGRVREMGCDLAQGHFFAEAVPGGVAKELVMRGIWSPGRS